jgi:hypothetical protein
VKDATAITSGRDLDWEAVEAAGKLIVKQAFDIGFCPPESVDIHRMRAGYVCDAMEKIAVALKLQRPTVVEARAEVERVNGYRDVEFAAFTSFKEAAISKIAEVERERDSLRQRAKEAETELEAFKAAVGNEPQRAVVPIREAIEKQTAEEIAAWLDENTDILDSDLRRLRSGAWKVPR